MQTTLIDTHALLWWLSGDRQLPAACREHIEDPGHHVLVSAVSAWEVAIKHAVGKLDMPEGLLEVVERSGLEWIPIEPDEAHAAGSLPLHHRDPFDRLLVSQALARKASLISGDRMLDRYGIRRLWG